ncbi:putative peroxidase [Helianthus anomalus]
MGIWDNHLSFAYPNALSTIKTSINVAVSRNGRNEALVIRFQGCDASLLLGGAGSEKESPANDGVLGYDVIDDVKATVESVCPRVVSCVDILVVTARDASVAVIIKLN